MDARIALPGGMALAMALGIGFSALVPTQMVYADAPAWQLDSARELAATTTAPQPTFAFADAAPVDLDPSLEVGPQYRLGEDAMGYSVPASSIDPAEAQARPAYVSISYGTRQAVAQPRPHVATAEPVALAAVETSVPLDATIY